MRDHERGRWRQAVATAVEVARTAGPYVDAGVQVVLFILQHLN